MHVMRQMELILILMLGVFCAPVMLWATPPDSIGVKVENGKTYILHEVDPGETLTRISKRYGVAIAVIQSANGMENASLSVGQVLRVPSKAVAPAPGSEQSEHMAKPMAPPKSARNPLRNARTSRQIGSTPAQRHTVAKGETMYALSRKYGVTVEQLSKWNSLDGTALRVGQQLIVRPPSATATTPVPEKKAEPATTPAPNPKDSTTPTPKPSPAATPTATPKPETTASKSNTVHTVAAGETLYAIARKYGTDVKELRRLNRLTTSTVKVGQKLHVSNATVPNPNQGTSLINMIDEVEEDADGAADAKTDSLETVREEFSDLKVLTTTGVMKIPESAVATLYKDRYSGKQFQRVQETGTVGKIEDFSTDQTRFYAFHKYLPVGAYIRVDYPDKRQSILVEVASKLPETDTNVIRLTSRCFENLMMQEEGAEVRIRYVVPLGK